MSDAKEYVTLGKPDVLEKLDERDGVLTYNGDKVSQLPEDVSDAVQKKHTHSNKATLDEFHCDDLETPEPELSIDGMDDPTRNLLSWRGQALRMINDGGVVQGAKEVTVNGKKYLRLMFYYDPVVEMYDIEEIGLEVGQTVRPRFIDIPIESSDDSTIIDGGLTLNGTTIDFGLDSLEQEVASIQPDWSENDPSDRAYIANRTHWIEQKENEKSFTLRCDGDGEVDCEDVELELLPGKTYAVTESHYNNNTDQNYSYSGNLVCQEYTIEPEEDYTISFWGAGNFDLLFSMLGMETPEDLANDTDCPVLIIGGVSDEPLMIFANESCAGCTLSLTVAGIMTVYKELDQRFIPSSIPRNPFEPNDKDLIQSLSFGSFGSNNELKFMQYQGNYFVPENIVYLNEQDGIYSFSMMPDVMYRIGSKSNPASVISIQGKSYINSFAQFMFDFYSGETPTRINFVYGTWKFQTPLVVEANKHYIISFYNEVGLWAAVEET